MKSLYSRNNSFNHPIFHSKFLELLSRNNKTKKKITMESLSFRHILSTSKISNTNSNANTNTNTNANSLIKQSKPKNKNAKKKININSKHKYSMSNDIFNFNDCNKKINNMDAIHTIYTTKGNSKNKINYNSIIANTNTNINSNNTKKRSKNKNNNCIKNEKSKSKNKKTKNKKNKSKIFINLENDLSLKRENQRLKIQLLELQNEYEKLKNENDLLVSQNRSKNNLCLSKQREKTDISNEKKTKKINKLNCNILNLEMNNIDNNYPCDYFNIINTNTKSNQSPIHDYITSNKRIYNYINYNNMQDKDIISNKISRDNINCELQNGSMNYYFTIGNNDKINNNNISYNSKILNTSKNKILISMYNLKNIKNKLNKSNTRIITPGNTSYTSSTLLNTEKFIQNLKKNKLKEKLRPQQLIYVPNNKKKEDIILLKSI